MCSKVATINSKHGPFDILFCTGNFFDKETSQELIDEILENKLDCKCQQKLISAMTKAYVKKNSLPKQRSSRFPLSFAQLLSPYYNILYSRRQWSSRNH